MASEGDEALQYPMHLVANIMNWAEFAEQYWLLSLLAGALFLCC